MDFYGVPKVFLNSLIYKIRKVVHAHNKNVWGHGITLPNPMTRLKKGCERVIDKNTRSHSCDTSHD